MTVTPRTLGGVTTAEITVDGIGPRHVVLYIHGGVYVIGDAFLAADLASQVGRPTQARVSSDVEVTRDITRGVPHVFQAYFAILDEGPRR